MIQELHVLHYLDRTLYEAVCSRLGLDAERKINQDNKVFFEPPSPVRSFHAYHIDYAAFGPIDFLDSVMILQTPDSLENLYGCYETLLGREIAGRFPPASALNCHFVAFEAVFPVPCAVDFLDGMARAGLPPEALCQKTWARVKKPHGSPTLLAAAQDEGHVRLRLAINGTAMKRAFPEKACVGTGISLPQVLEAETEPRLLARQMKKMLRDPMAEVWMGKTLYDWLGRAGEKRGI